MRARWLKPEFFTDKKVAQSGATAALVFQALWCLADDGGVSIADADYVKGQLFFRWADIGTNEIEEALRHLTGTGQVRLYDVGDTRYAEIQQFAKHQPVHKPSKFRHPRLSRSAGSSSTKHSGTTPALVPEKEGIPVSSVPQHPDTCTASPRAREAVPEEFRGDLDQLLDRVPNREAWAAQIAASTNGANKGRGPVPTAEQLGQAIRDFNANAAEPKLTLFRAYLRRATAEPIGGSVRTQRKPTGGPRRDSYEPSQELTWRK